MSSEILSGFWTDIRPHAERDAVFMVDPELELAVVAMKVAQDDTAAVNDWVQRKLLARPTPEQIAAWNKSAAKSFRFVILQPYVFVQELAH